MASGIQAVAEAIDRIDWESVRSPDPPAFVRRSASRGLRALALAGDQAEAVGATGYLFDSVLVDRQLAVVMPAAAAAAPVLVGIAAHGHPWARAGAGSLLGAMLEFLPFEGFTRVDTEHATAVPLCCAVAHQVAAGRAELAARGRESAGLLRAAEQHWRFEVTEAVGTGPQGLFAVGDLTGELPAGPVRAELHTPAGGLSVIGVEVEYPAWAGGTEACLRVGSARGAGLDGAVLMPAGCGARVY
ncbi:hypothetical protein ACFYNO_17065 [Kitasatospora sp. NPDC006697]|uniref:hypothetical protein n=1 Tax=Kitasatospora sp. NPDC006697 TaxID=3364020 RepID=UPI0036A40E1E